MRATIAAIGLVLMGSSQAFSEPQLLKGKEFAVYHACLNDSWTVAWCHTHEIAFEQCMISYGGGKYTDRWHLFADTYCYRVAKGLVDR